MSSPTSGSDQDSPQGDASQGQPGWNAPQSPPQGYGDTSQGQRDTSQGYGAAPQGYGTAPQGYGTAPQGYGAAPQGYGAAPQGYGAGPQGYGAAPQGHGGGPAPAYAGAPGGTGQRPGMVTAAGIVGIVWGALGLLLGLVALTVAFSMFGGVYGLLVLVGVVLSGALLFAGIQVMQGKSPRLLLLISYVAIGVNVLTMIWSATQGAGIFSGLLGFIIPGVVVFLLLNPQSKQYYASQGISY